MAFKYRGKERTVESVTRRSRESSGNFESYVLSDVKMFKPKEGENNVRILPPTWEDVDKWGDGWEIAAHLHYGIGPDNGAYLCLDKMKGGELAYAYKVLLDSRRLLENKSTANISAQVNILTQKFEEEATNINKLLSKSAMGKGKKIVEAQNAAS